MAGANVHIDLREFTETLRKYAEYSKRDPALICNTKAFIILRKATYKTPKATKAQIREDLLKIGDKGAPIAALLVNKLRMAQGLPGLFGRAMKDAVEALIKGRKVATLRGGNVDAMKALAPYIDKGVSTSLDRTTAGKPKGKASPAKEGSWAAAATFENFAGAKWDTRDTATPKALPAWEEAFREEEASMLEYIENKLRKSAQKAGIHTN